MFKCDKCGNEFMLPKTIITPLSDPSKIWYDKDNPPKTHEEAVKLSTVSVITYHCPKCDNEVWGDRRKPFDNEYSKRKWHCVLIDDECMNQGKCRKCEIGKREKNISL